MKYGKFLVVMAAFMIEMSTLAPAATVTTSLRLQDTNGVDLAPVSPGVFSIPAGTTVQVVLSARVNSPNFTDTNRNPNVNDQPLGLQSLNVNIITPGTNGVWTPVGDGSGPPQQWVGYNGISVGAFSFVNLVDTDSDGDLDAAGVGMGLTTTALPTSATVTILQNLQVGALQTDDIAAGWYTVNQSGPITLQALITAAAVYGEPIPDTNGTSAQKAALQVYDVTANSTSGSLIFIPEPASMSLVGLTCLALLGIRRRSDA